MYSSLVDSQDQAICHLFFHCCLEDGEFTESEMSDLSGKLVGLGLSPRVNIKEELIRYRSYKPTISDEQAYLKFLTQLIKPVNELALYSYCLELCIDDPTLDAREEALLEKLRETLAIEPTEANVINRLTAQRKAVETQKIF